jgi:Rrf2 family protein
MKLHTDVRYAIRIIFALSCAQSPLSICYLAEKTGIAPRAVELAHTCLKRHGITTSLVGAKGGIELAVAPEKISLGKLIEIFDNGVEFFICTGDRSNECPDMDACSMRSAWRSLSEKFQQELNSVTLDGVLRQYAAEKSGTMRGARCV